MFIMSLKWLDYKKNGRKNGKKTKKKERRLISVLIYVWFWFFIHMSLCKFLSVNVCVWRKKNVIDYHIWLLLYYMEYIFCFIYFTILLIYSNFWVKYFIIYMFCTKANKIVTGHSYMWDEIDIKIFILNVYLYMYFMYSYWRGIRQWSIYEERERN